MNIKALFRRKEPELEVKDCVFNHVIVLSDSEYEHFRKHLLNDYDFIRDHREEMGVREGMIHCILVLHEESGDGILVNSEGADYARYVAHFPGAGAYLEQQRREEMHRQRFPEGRLLTQAEVNRMRDKHTKWLYDQPGGEQADFSNCYLFDLDLHDMDLMKANFRNAVLDQVKLEDAYCHGADFMEATFFRCDAHCMIASGADFSRAVFSQSDFSQCCLDGCRLYGAGIKASYFASSSIRNCELEDEVAAALKEAGAVDTDEEEVQEPVRWTDEDYFKMTFGGMV